MAIWLVRAGRKGEHQNFALDNGVVVIGWDGVHDLSQFETRGAIEVACRDTYAHAKPKTITNWVGQLWAFANRIKVGDLVGLPLKGQNAIAFGRVTDTYRYRPDNPAGARNTLPVEWVTRDTRRDLFGQDILFSFGAFMTVCQIKRNDAEARIRATLEGNPDRPPETDNSQDDVTDEVVEPDLEEIAGQQIQEFIRQNFAGHKLADIVDAVLRAQGYQTEKSPPGPDGGVDVIAGRGPMGFDAPRLCVQVKATSQQQDVKAVRELRGVMHSFGAEQGLFVSWSGFKRSVIAEARRQFFQIRLWDADAVVDAVQQHYDLLPEDLKAELPLKRIWTLVLEKP
jgi:restriction system protein